MATATKTEKKPHASKCKKAERILNEWLAKHDWLKGDAKVYTTEQWRERGEQYGRTAFATLTLDGSPMYEMVNYGNMEKTHEEFNELLRKNGFYYELGYAWAMNIYE
jgi:hypothetical protein